MEPHYDFSDAERGKFCRKDARPCLPIYLDGQLQKRFERIAEQEGIGLGEFVSRLLLEDVELLEADSARG